MKINVYRFQTDGKGGRVSVQGRGWLPKVANANFHADYANKIDDKRTPARPALRQEQQANFS